MKKFLPLITIVVCFYELLTSCNTETPEDYFDIAVLSCNSMHGFASEGLQRELESPTVKMVDGNKDKVAPMKRKEIIDSKIESIEPNLEKVKQLKQTDQTKELLQASLALHEYVLPVYKNEYQQLAKLYDDGASKEQIAAFEQSIEQKYFSKFAELYDKLTAAGKSYAKKNNINVNWDIHTSPQ